MLNFFSSGDQQPIHNQDNLFLRDLNPHPQPQPKYGRALSRFNTEMQKGNLELKKHDIQI